MLVMSLCADRYIINSVEKFSCKKGDMLSYQTIALVEGVIIPVG
jgi:hypothetical protein